YAFGVRADTGRMRWKLEQPQQYQWQLDSNADEPGRDASLRIYDIVYAEQRDRGQRHQPELYYRIRLFFVRWNGDRILRFKWKFQRKCNWDVSNDRSVGHS